MEYPNKPEKLEKLSERDIVLTCVRAAQREIKNMPPGPAAIKANTLLVRGAIRRSRLHGVNWLGQLVQFIEALEDPTMVVLLPGTQNPLIKFALPRTYSATTSVARVKDLGLEEKAEEYVNNIHLCFAPLETTSGVEWAYRLHAPMLYPVNTDSVTFILTPGWDNLVRWFVGEEISLWGASGNLGSHWVHLGVDLRKESMYIKKNVTHGKKSTTIQPVFVPSAPPIPVLV